MVDLRLIRTLIAALLAVCVAVFPIAMPQAARLTHHSHGATSAHFHPAGAESQAAHLAGCDGAPSAVAHHDHTSHEGGADADEGSSCCGSAACHAFQVSAGPTLGHRLPLTDPVRAPRDEQVAMTMPSGLDRPPRTV